LPAGCSALSTRLLSGAVFQLKTGTTVNYTLSATGSDGTACLGSIVPGSYTLHESTAPTGYSAGADQTVQISPNTSCAAGGGAATASVTDLPLTTITVSTTPVVAGSTESTVQCADAGDQSAFATPHTTGTVVPGTYHCTVIIDP
jgi:hypothetical protein